MSGRIDYRIWQWAVRSLRDESVMGLLISNIIIIIWALYAKWDALTVMWLYWAQSVIIGLFWALRIIAHQKLYRRNKTDPHDGPERLSLLSRIGTAGSFAFHYEFFHLGYLAFLCSGVLSRSKGSQPPMKELAIAGAVFFASELLSFIRDARPTVQKPAEIGSFMGFPYMRILPMYLLIIIGGFLRSSNIGGSLVLLIFLVLKTVADIDGHIRLRRGFFDKEILKAAKPPRVLRTPEDDKLVLSNGQVISLSSHPQVREHLQSILQLPLEVQDEVCMGLMAKEDGRGQPSRQFKCRCSKAGKISGPGVPAYVEGHLRLLWKMDDGSQLYVCPQTGKHWVKTNDTLKAKQ